MAHEEEEEVFCQSRWNLIIEFRFTSTQGISLKFCTNNYVDNKISHHFQGKNKLSSVSKIHFHILSYSHDIINPWALLLKLCLKVPTRFLNFEKYNFGSIL